MKSTKKSSSKTAEKPLADRIKEKYITTLLNNGDRPNSVYAFCMEHRFSEEDFYSVAGSFDSLERLIWNDYLQQTIDRLTADAEFRNFGTRDRILAFYYSLFETLKPQRSFVLYSLEGFRKPEIVPDFLKTFKKTFVTFIESQLTEGKSAGEVAKRPYLDKGYPELFWLHAAFLLSFWVRDDSAGFEQTDAAIEKSVNLAFDLIGKGPVDSALDFLKFIYQTRIR